MICNVAQVISTSAAILIATGFDCAPVSCREPIIAWIIKLISIPATRNILNRLISTFPAQRNNCHVSFQSFGVEAQHIRHLF